MTTLTDRPTLESQLTHALETDDFAKQARVLIALGKRAQEDKEYDLAQGLYAQARDAAAKGHDPAVQAEALAALGYSFINGDLNEQRAACTYFEEALALYEQLGDIQAQSLLYIALSYSLWRLDDTERRLRLYPKALACLAQLQDAEEQSSRSIELAGSMYGHRDFAPLYEKALHMHQQAEYRRETPPSEGTS